MEINDIILCVILGLSILAFVFIVLSEIKNTVKDSGVDDVLDELFKTVQNQPKTVHTEEEKKDLDWKFRE